MVFAAVTGFAAYLLYRKNRISLRSFAASPLLALYLAFVSTITVTSRETTVKARYQLTLFWTYKAIQKGRTYLKAEIFWNVVLFVPVGILLSLLFPKRRSWIAVIISLFLSCAIELVQLLLHRGLFEFDDIIHNTAGALIGFVLCLTGRAVAGKARA